MRSDLTTGAPYDTMGVAGGTEEEAQTMPQYQIQANTAAEAIGLFRQAHPEAIRWEATRSVGTLDWTIQYDVRPTQDRDIAGRKVTFRQIPGGRWVFTGSLNAGGYLTVDDAAIEAQAQIEHRAQGGLNQQPVEVKTHRRTWRQEIQPAASRY